MSKLKYYSVLIISFLGVVALILVGGHFLSKEVKSHTIYEKCLVTTPPQSLLADFNYFSVSRLADDSTFQVVAQDKFDLAINDTVLVTEAAISFSPVQGIISGQDANLMQAMTGTHRVCIAFPLVPPQ